MCVCMCVCVCVSVCVGVYYMYVARNLSQIWRKCNISRTKLCTPPLYTQNSYANGGNTTNFVMVSSPAEVSTYIYTVFFQCGARIASERADLVVSTG